MEFQRQSFSDVVLDLARRYQLPVETVDGPQQERLRQQLSRRDHLHRALALASGWFRSQLKSSSGKEALEYLRDQRGLSEATLETFELGYAPDQWDGLLKHLQHVEGLSPELLESAGLLVPRKAATGFMTVSVVGSSFRFAIARDGSSVLAVEVLMAVIPNT
jgi:DNA primase